jgi:aminoglycoside phosphotransferase (APT) family kinase protein
LAAPIDVEPTWIHGDLHAQNVLLDAGRISAVIDWGDMAVGDRATDLACIWMLLPDADVRERALRYVGPLSPSTRARARGWAVLFGVLLLDSGLAGDPRFAAMGACTLRQVAEGP